MAQSSPRKTSNLVLAWFKLTVAGLFKSSLQAIMPGEFFTADTKPVILSKKKERFHTLSASKELF